MSAYSKAEIKEMSCWACGSDARVERRRWSLGFATSMPRNNRGVIEMTTDTHTLAARLARADVGEEFWARVTPHFQRHAIERWKDSLETVRRAGLAVVEAEEGR